MLGSWHDHNLIIALLLDFEDLLHLANQGSGHSHICLSDRDAQWESNSLDIIRDLDEGWMSSEGAIDQWLQVLGCSGCLGLMALDACGRQVLGKHECVLTTPAETTDTDLEGGCLEWWGRGAEVFEEFEDSRTADAWSGGDEPGDGVVHGLESVEGLVEDGGEDGGGLHELLHDEEAL